jgi:phosphoribosylaminoimidazole carboxylase (NCAIR synthetase)
MLRIRGLQHHVNGILTARSFHAANGAAELAEAIVAALDYVGVLAVKCSSSMGNCWSTSCADHNSGHWTSTLRTSQFEQQVRAVCVGPGDPSTTVPAVAMVNARRSMGGGGRLAAALADPAASLHLYGKTTATRPQNVTSR